MPTDKIIEQYKGLTAAEIIRQLEDKYKDDADAIEEIERTKKNIAYIASQKDYKGQTPEQCALSLAGSLEYWA